MIASVLFANALKIVMSYASAQNTPPSGRRKSPPTSYETCVSGSSAGFA